MDDLVEWLKRQLDEDELVARDAGGRNWGREAYGCVVDAADNGLIVYSEGTPSRDQADHIARHDPARVLREVEAKRRILNEVLPKIDTLQGACDEEWGARSEPDAADVLLHLLALPYSDPRPITRADCDWRTTPRTPTRPTQTRTT